MAHVCLLHDLKMAASIPGTSLMFRGDSKGVIYTSHFFEKTQETHSLHQANPAWRSIYLGCFMHLCIIWLVNGEGAAVRRSLSFSEKSKGVEVELGKPSSKVNVLPRRLPGMQFMVHGWPFPSPDCGASNRISGIHLCLRRLQSQDLWSSLI